MSTERIPRRKRRVVALAPAAKFATVKVAHRTTKDQRRTLRYLSAVQVDDGDPVNITYRIPLGARTFAGVQTILARAGITTGIYFADNGLRGEVFQSAGNGELSAKAKPAARLKAIVRDTRLIQWQRDFCLAVYGVQDCFQRDGDGALLRPSLWPSPIDPALSSDPRLAATMLFGDMPAKERFERWRAIHVDALKSDCDQSLAFLRAQRGTAEYGIARNIHDANCRREELARTWTPAIQEGKPNKPRPQSPFAPVPRTNDDSGYPVS